MEKKLAYIVAQFESILIQEIKESFFLEAFFRLKPQDVTFFRERTLWIYLHNLLSGFLIM